MGGTASSVETYGSDKAVETAEVAVDTVDETTEKKCPECGAIILDEAATGETANELETDSDTEAV